MASVSSAGEGTLRGSRQGNGLGPPHAPPRENLVLALSLVHSKTCSAAFLPLIVNDPVPFLESKWGLCLK